MLDYTTTPIQKISNSLLDNAGVQLLVKREDLNHNYISGNKWWKLKLNLEEAKKCDFKTLLTFGGAFSNHIYSTAAAAKELNMKCIGVIRGEKTFPFNTTLTFAEQQGMTLHYINREAYRLKTTNEFLENLKHDFGEFYLIPEGGTNDLAVKGCAEFAERELKNIEFDYLCLPVGTGGTIAGLISGFKGEKKIIGIPVLKNVEYLEDEIQKLSENYSGKLYGNWELLTSYHHGGYAKVSPDLMKFIVMMKAQHNLPLDFVYTGKLMWAVMKEIEKGKFVKGSTILVLHTGGLQGATNL